MKLAVNKETARVLLAAICDVPPGGGMDKIRADLQVFLEPKPILVRLTSDEIAAVVDVLERAEADDHNPDGLVFSALPKLRVMYRRQVISEQASQVDGPGAA